LSAVAGSTFRLVLQRATTPLIYLVLLVVWEAAVRVFKIPGWMLPAPSAIVAAARDWAPDLLHHSLVTLNESVIGFLVALALSLPFAVLIAFTVTLRRVFYPILLGLQSVPKVALAPLVILWLGLGSLPKIVIVLLVCFFPILVNVVAGFEAVPKAMLDLMHSMCASETAIFRRLRIPIALPHLFTGCKIAITFAVIGAVISEFVAAQDGLGYLIMISTAQSQTPLAFAAIILLTVISVVLFYAVEFLERRFVTWTA
jgi:NitT/TauT family transport system permease protein